METETEIQREQENSVKLNKMSKGYNWEIKIYQKSLTDQEVLNKIAFFDKNLKEAYNNVGETNTNATK